MWGDHREVAAKNQWFGKEALDAGTCSARWTGFIEATVSEDFTFHVYTCGHSTYNRGGQSNGATGAKVRLWIDGKLIIDSWDKVTPAKVDGYVRTRWLKSQPLALGAGKLVTIKLEYAAAGDKDAHLHLYWESKSTDLRHVPAVSLYKEPMRPAVSVTAKQKLTRANHS